MATPFDFQTALTERRQNNLYRRRLVIESAQQAEVLYSGESYLAFCSNDYLGLANHPKVVAAYINAAKEFGVGSGASHLVIGHNIHHHALEEELADFVGRDRALLFSSGYMANMGVINALVGKGDTVLQDKLNHASLLDGGLLSGAGFKRYLHADINSLENNLGKVSSGHCLIVTDGVFSMDGDKAPVREISQLAQKYNALTMVDDAHGFGCIGSRGAGLLDELELDQTEVPILMATLGKALGGSGAFVAGSEALIETLIQFARTYIYSTGMPPALAAAMRESLRIVQMEAERRESLQSLIEYFKNGAAQLGLPLMPSATAIQPILLGASEVALDVSNKLKQDHILVTAIRPPTVPAGTARLRITLSAAHKKPQIDRLLESLAKHITVTPLNEAAVPSPRAARLKQ